MRLILTTLLIFLSFLSTGNSLVRKQAKATWVNLIEGKENNEITKEGDFHYLLTDYQSNISTQEVYKHYVVELLNSNGVQSLSDLSMDFDPSYQKLTIHQVVIKRGGKVLNKLPEAKIQTMQREGNMERNMYDGSVTAIIHLSDIREKDVLEYSYTIKNFNPINQGNYSEKLYQEYFTAVNRVYSRVVTNSSNPIKFQLKNGATKPKKIVNGSVKEYIWDVKNALAKNTDNNVPMWYEDKSYVLISTFKDWLDVVNWALPLYNSEPLDIENFDESFIGLDKNRITEIINWVQDEVRYLGFESGIGAYKPNSPKTVAKQRYGDCKDKSLLLVSFLRNEGIEAYPLLVNSYKNGHISSQLPSNQAFNHCVVQYRLDGENYYVDPTYSGQGGDYSKKQFPYYGKGLVVKKGESSLVKIPMEGKGKIKVKEVYTVNEKGTGSANLWVRTSYYGNRADGIRDYFKSNTKESIKKEYLNFYSTIYPEIISTQNVKIIDNSKNSTNEIFVEEYYEISNFWKNKEELGYTYCEFEPLVLNSLLGYPQTVSRTMPYDLGTPYYYSQETEVVLPEEWQVFPDETEIKGDGFVYRNRIVTEGNRLFITNTYDLTKSYINADSVSKFLQQHEQINNGISYQVSYSGNEEGFKISWVSVLIVCLSILIGVFVMLKIHREFDPVPEYLEEGQPFGGWLILSAIGITISPLVFLREIIISEHFDENTWNVLLSGALGNSFEMTMIVGLEIFYNFMFLIFSIFLVIQFYQKRSSFPKLIVIYYGLALIVPVIDSYLVSEFMMYEVDFMDEEVVKSFVQTFISGVIWGLYYTLSSRVRMTFVNRLNG